MNDNQKHYLKILTLAGYTIAVFLVITILWKSKTFFEKNYNKHEILESDANLYKVESQQEPNKANNEIELIEQQPIEIHTEVTEIATPANTLPQTTAIKTESLQTEPAKTSKETKTEIKTSTPETKPIKKQTSQKPIENKAKPTPKDTKAKKPIKKTEKPATLNKPESVSQSVAKNPLFQSYIVQTGAFSTLQKAEMHKIALLKLQSVNGYKTEISSKNNIHKVYVGFFENHNAAEKLCTTLKQQNVQCFVTKL